MPMPFDETESKQSEILHCPIQDGLGRLGGSYAKFGKRSEGENIIKQLQEMSTRRYVPPVYLNVVS
jgi:hypothetical protein